MSIVYASILHAFTIVYYPILWIRYNMLQSPQPIVSLLPPSFSHFHRHLLTSSHRLFFSSTSCNNNNIPSSAAVRYTFSSSTDCVTVVSSCIHKSTPHIFLLTLDLDENYRLFQIFSETFLHSPPLLAMQLFLCGVSITSGGIISILDNQVISTFPLSKTTDLTLPKWSEPSEFR